MREAFTIVRVAGIPIRLHWSWFVVLALATWTLAAGYFPAQLPDASARLAWLYGLLASLLLFGSVLLHELSHAFVARRVGVPVSGITLHVFGGVAQLEREPDSPGAEFAMAIVGPLTSYVIAAVCWLPLRAWQLSSGGEAILLYLSTINVLVGTFNLIPGFPLDGGRLLRSALWAWRRDLAWATRIASYAGTAFGVLLMALGALRVMSGELLGGLWLVLIGAFLQQAASGSYAQLVARRSLGRVAVHEAMTRAVVTVPGGLTLAELVEGYFWHNHVASFPVVDGHGPGSVVRGIVTMGQVKAVPRERWSSTLVTDVMVRLRDDLIIRPTASCWEALTRMTRNGLGRLAVVDAGRLVGYLSVRDLAHLLALETAGGEDLIGRRPQSWLPGLPRNRAA
jgi:Zn-dependent protease